jgi:hypothetical protein
MAYSVISQPLSHSPKQAHMRIRLSRGDMTVHVCAHRVGGALAPDGYMGYNFLTLTEIC